MHQLTERQIWATSSPTQTQTIYSHTLNPTATTRLSFGTSTVTAAPSAVAAASSDSNSSLCTIALPAGGTLWVNDTYFTILADTITFESPCENQTIHGCPNGGLSNVVKSNDPFFTSVPTQIYALAIATVISYILLLLLFITPRTFYVGGPGGGANFLGLRSLVPGSGSSNVIGVGRRPLLQKIAVLTVAASLTIATADTFRVAERQYNDGIMNSQQLVEDVISSVEIRVIRVVSDTFLWLAQVQTLIRLFPRHKEKVTIKWLGFALVTCDTVFSILENFISGSTLTRPRSFQDAIPALSYLFQMSISLIYASCVIYYSLSKRRFAFWHSKMKNILLLATISLAAVLIPVVFFVIDVAQPSIAAWGEYIRWVGAAAASVVVWEWVERIEALERDERKDGILGREIFDGDEMLDMGSDGKSSSTSTYFGFGTRSCPDGDKKFSILPLASMRPHLHLRKPKAITAMTTSYRRSKKPPTGPTEADNSNITRPHQAITPASRTDTTSPASTVYQVRYQNVSSPSPAIPEEQPDSHQLETIHDSHATAIAMTEPALEQHPTQTDDHEQPRDDQQKSRQAWQAVANPFKRKRAEPPAEVAAQLTTTLSRRSPAQTYNNLRERITAMASRRDRATRQRQGPSPPMPVTVIPAQPRPGRNSLAEQGPQSTREQSLRSNRSSTSKRSRENLPVTVIPPPIRGGRTWSPDDLEDSPSAAPRHSPTTTPDTNLVTRGTLTIADSPVRRPDSRNTPPSTSRTANRLRAPTIDSLNDRLSSSSPNSAAAHSSSSAERPRSSPLNANRNMPDDSQNAVTGVIPELVEDQPDQQSSTANVHRNVPPSTSPGTSHRDNG